MAKTKKGLGQNWLSDQESLLAMVQAARVASGDQVLEIGPGLGYLTDKLLAAKAEVLALEFDQDLIPQLQKKYDGSSNLSLQQGDIRTFDLSGLPADYKICANIPYYLSANLLRILTDTLNKPSVVALMVQKEVAQKVAAPVGKRSMLATLVQAQYYASVGTVVPADLFQPPPKVDSQILILSRRSEALVAPDGWPELARLIKLAFSNPRKKLRSNLSAGLQLDKTQTDDLLGRASIDLASRAEQLTGQQWLGLHRALKA